MSRVLIVGAGLTGSLCACLLRREIPPKVKIVVWDKSRGAGGRMNTSRSPDNVVSCTADLGAQYITASPHYAQLHHSFYEELLAHGVLKPQVSSIEGMMMMTEEHKNYTTPAGMSSIVTHFLKQSGAEVFFHHQVTHVYRRGAAWEVVQQGGAREEFDVLVLTMPVPQILQLQGDLGSLLAEGQRQQLEKVVYSSRFALALFFSSQDRLPLPWAAKYVSNNPCIRFISIHDKKHNTDRGSSMVVHTSVPFGVHHLEKDKREVEPIILEELNKLLPGLPQPISTKCHKWRYSQVSTAVADCPGQMTLLARPLLVCGGDAFTHSNFDGCVESALQVLAVIKSSL